VSVLPQYPPTANQNDGKNQPLFQDLCHLQHNMETVTAGIEGQDLGLLLTNQLDAPLEKGRKVLGISKGREGQNMGLYALLSQNGCQ
jgi:hypothetical protein